MFYYCMHIDWAARRDPLLMPPFSHTATALAPQACVVIYAIIYCHSVCNGIGIGLGIGIELNTGPSPHCLQFSWNFASWQMLLLSQHNVTRSSQACRPASQSAIVYYYTNSHLGCVSSVQFLIFN